APNDGADDGRPGGNWQTRGRTCQELRRHRSRKGSGRPESEAGQTRKASQGTASQSAGRVENDGAHAPDDDGRSPETIGLVRAAGSFIMTPCACAGLETRGWGWWKARRQETSRR